ncbi:hypothetical protein CRUP_001860, partial [Coryphaenoides rupestris]
MVVVVAFSDVCGTMNPSGWLPLGPEEPKPRVESTETSTEDEDASPHEDGSFSLSIADIPLEFLGGDVVALDTRHQEHGGALDLRVLPRYATLSHPPSFTSNHHVTSFDPQNIQNKFRALTRDAIMSYGLLENMKFSALEVQEYLDTYNNRRDATTSWLNDCKTTFPRVTEGISITHQPEDEKDK